MTDSSAVFTNKLQTFWETQICSDVLVNLIALSVE